MQKKIISLTFIAVLLFGCSDLNSIVAPTKRVNKNGDIVSVGGRWKAMAETKYKLISKINSTSITCDHSDMTCREIAAFVFTPKEQPLLKNNSLYSQESSYPIIDWTDVIIKAKKETPVVDIELTISLKDKSAEKSFIQPKAGGNEPANLDAYGKWVLE